MQSQQNKQSASFDIFSGVIVGAFIVVILYLVVTRVKQNVETQQVNNELNIAIAKSAGEVPKVFANWSEKEVLENGDVLVWSGKTSKLLFTEQFKDCSSGRYENLYVIPCITVWAKTDQGKFFTVDIEPDLNAKYALKISTRHVTVSKKDTARKIIELKKESLLKDLEINVNGA